MAIKQMLLRGLKKSGGKPSMNRKLAANETHRTRCRGEFGVVYVMTGFFLENDFADKFDDFRTARTASENIAQVMFFGRKQACADLPIGGQANSRTRAAEHFGNGRDDSDFARRIIRKRIFPGGFAAAR